MSIDTIQSLQLITSQKELIGTTKPPHSFANWLTESLSATNTKLLEADHALQQLATGQASSLHQTMLKLEDAKLSFQFLEQIRNRLMTAYQDLLKEQI